MSGRSELHSGITSVDAVAIHAGTVEGDHPALVSIRHINASGTGSGRLFRTDGGMIGISGMEILNRVLHYVIVSEHIHSRKGLAPAAVAVGDRACRVDGMYELRHAAGDVAALGAVLDRPFLISYTPEYDAGMIHVATDHALDKVEMLAVHSHHAVFVNDEESKLVAQVEHRGRCGIVRAANRIEAVFLELQELVTPQFVGDACTDSRMVEMQVTALELDAIAVEKESLPGIEVRGADTDPDIVFVQKVFYAIVPLVQAGPERIEIRGVD